MAMDKAQVEALIGRVPYVRFEEYKDRFSKYLDMTREDGILVVRMHYKNNIAKWVMGLHAAIGEAFKYIGADPENGVMIITGTGDHWLGGLDPEYIEYMHSEARSDRVAYNRSTYNDWYTDGVPLLENLLWHVNIPTIAVLNGPSQVGHVEFALACDLTLCTPDFQFAENHYNCGLAPGDGQYITLQHLLGEKRANYMAYMGYRADAQTALEWGLVNEIVPHEKILDRAMEMARKIMEKDFHTRRLTHAIMTRQWRSFVERYFHGTYAMQCWAGCMNDPDPNKGGDSLHKD
ncbi:MAG: enoyl-CoA hydratase/isomerase family protein [Oscillospiraceae bacterium]